MKYRDYYSLKTLHRFGVDPERKLNTDGTPEQVKENILSAFGNTDRESSVFLDHKTDCALYDMHIAEPEAERVPIEISEALDDMARTDDFPITEIDSPSVDRRL